MCLSMMRTRHQFRANPQEATRVFGLHKHTLKPLRVAQSGGSSESNSSQSSVVKTQLPVAEEDGLSCVATGLGDVECVSDFSNGTSNGTLSPEESEVSTLQQVLNTALLVSPFAFWGTSMVAMKGLMLAVPPLLMGGFRLLPAGLVLVAWGASQGRPQPSTATAWAWVTAFALVDGAAFQGFLAEGLQRTSAGLGSVIIDSQPLTVAVLASLLFGEQLGVAGIVGLMVGVAGLLLLELPEQYLQLAAEDLLNVLPTTASSTTTSAVAAVAADASQALATSSAAADAAVVAAAATATAFPWSDFSLQDALAQVDPSTWADSGEFWMLAAAQSMAVGTVMVRYVTKHADPVMATGWHMVLGGILLTAMAVSADPSVVSDSASKLQPTDLASALYVSLLGGAASYGIFFWQASSQGNLTKLSSLTFLTPVFAAVSGYLVLGEVLTAPQLLGAAITLSSVFLITSSKGSKPDVAKKAE